MIDKFLKTAGVDNMEDFYKLHPTEDHFFKTYPHMKNEMKKGKKIRRAQKGGVMPNSLNHPNAPIDHYAGTYAPAKLRMQEGGEPQQEMMQQVMQMISGALEQGAEPKQVMQMLMQQGVPAEAAQQLMQMVMQQMSGAQSEGGEEYAQQTYADGGKLPREILRSRLESHMSPAEADDYLSTYAKGGIHIDPAKKGTFKAQATRMGMSVKEAARHIMANKENYSPAMVKKAVFAHNFAKQDGGYAMPSYGYGSAGVQPQGAQTNSQAYTIQRGVAVPMPTRAYGGYYQEGGEAMPQEMMEGAPQQMQEQAMGQEQQQGSQDQMMQQLMQMVMQALQEGMQPEQIMQMLVQQGVPQDVAMQVIQMVMQQMGGAPQGGPGEQYQSQGEQYQGPQAMAAYGGMYQIGGVTPHGAGTHGQQYTIKNGVAIPMGAYGGYYADGGFFNESYMPFDY
jgi:SOS response regulatory protein OraA/RecX